MKRSYTIILFLFCFLTKSIALSQVNSIERDTSQHVGDSVFIMLDTLRTVKRGAPTLVKDTLYLEQLTTDSDTSPHEDNMELSEGALLTPSLLATTDFSGRMEGTLDVSATGGAVYSIPFILPPGLGGVVPQLGLAYNSQGGMGIAGYGWNISGLSSISRVGAVEYIDGFIGSVNFNADDRFALDGQRLLLKSGVYGGDGAEYQTEQYSNLKIISRGVSPYGAAYGPAYFEVNYPDGSKAFYGFISNSRNRTTYAITYSESPLLARISYAYNESNNNLYVQSIAYGNRSSTGPINEINFYYTSATRKEQVYTGGTGFLQGRILSKITIKANGMNYRHYVPSYGTVSPLNYQRMTAIQEFDGAEEKAFSPIFFNYGGTSNTIAVTTLSNLNLAGIAGNNASVLTADFTGDGKMDFLLYPPAKNEFWAFYDLETDPPDEIQLGWWVNIGLFREIFSATWLTWNEKVFTEQGIMLVKENGTNKFKFPVYSTSSTFTPAAFEYERLWNDVPIIPKYRSYCDHQEHDNVPQTFEFISGDFNGDGLTDIVAINESKYVITIEVPDGPQYPVPNCKKEYAYTQSNFYFIDMDRRLPAVYTSSASPLSNRFISGEKLYTADFNGDGKTDILHVKHGTMDVYSLVDGSFQRLWTITDSRIVNNVNNPTLIGDYNGDGKMDVMFATGYNNVFTTFMSTGTSFVKHEKAEPFYNREMTWDGITLNQYFLIPTDIDGDGKTDMIYSKTTTYNSSPTGNIMVDIHHNTNVSSTSQPIFGAAKPSSKSTNVRHYPIPIFLNPNRPNQSLEFGFISDNTITLFNSLKDMRRESQLVFMQNRSIYHTIDYGKLLSGSYYDDIPTYQGSYEQTYPYVDIYNAPSFSVVTKITRSNFGAQQAMQVFGYANAVSHFGGMGFLGFGKVIRTNWHINAGDANRTLTIGIQDPQLRGANVRTFVTKSPYLNPTIKDMPLSNPPPAGGIVDGATLSDYISRQDVAYSTLTLPNKVFVNTSVATASKNMLEGTFSTQTIQYDAYYNPTLITENINGIGTSTVENTYGNSSGSTYYIGRLLTSLKTMDNGSDTYSTKEEYTYTGYLPTTIKRKGHGTDYITESRVYDIFGNTTERTLTVPGGAQRTESMEYDITGRFLTKNTDLEGLSTQYTYNNSTGNLLSRTNPYSQTETYEYDSWGRQTETIDFLGNTSNRSYGSATYDIEITESDTEGRYQKTIINPWGQTTEVQEKTLLGQFVGKAWQYDVYGRQTGESETAALGTYSQWNTVNYDTYGRLSKSTSYTGKEVNYSYSGLSTTSNDGTKTVTTTKDAFGSVVSMQDPGGTVNYTYFANGNLKKSDYNGSIQTVEQDGWGRKTKLTDPSAGIYEYEYDGFDQLTKETTPKGVNEYVYDAAGKLTEKSIVGDSTDMQYSYTYNATTKLLTGTSLTNADGNNATYSYSYDTHKRLSSMSEDNVHARFEKSFTYDSFGRINTQKQEAKDKLSNISVDKTVLMQYQNGELLQTMLQGTGQVLWKVDSLNPKGMIGSTLQGNSLKNTFRYDAYNLPQQSKVDRITGIPANLMMLGYDFNAQRGLLKNRSNSAFSWSETFTYDSFDRLISFDDNNGNNSQGYDSRGRIVNNSQLGLYSYTGSSYQQEGLELNSTADPYYYARSLQEISYNAFKSPVEIVEPGHERISFQYNAALGRSHMYYGDEQVDKMLRPYRRHYAEDGGVEITKDMLAGTTSFVFYLAGDAYSAPAIWKEVHGSSPTTANLYYLHRDHLGSIVMISDTLGTVVEKRVFDAWGNIVKLTDGSNNILPNFVILDRGFTGHEHLTGVVLIHMNARLYDPKLHRFLGPDNYVQDMFNTQNFNRYGYALNNPLSYVDQDGEFLWFIPVIAAVVFGGTNLAIQASKGEIHNFWDGVKAFGAGAVVGATLSTGVAFGLTVPLVAAGIKTAGAVYGAVTIGSAFSGLAQGVFEGDWSRLENTGKLFAGNFYLDPNRNFFGQVLQGTSRFTWEIGQTTAGYSYSQIRNAVGNVDRVDYFGGATFSTRESHHENHGISLGNFINVSIDDEITGKFDDRVLSDPLYMHEYGHTFDSQLFGPLYLVGIGLPSFAGAKWTERRANRWANWYFGKDPYKIDWERFYNRYPLKR